MVDKHTPVTCYIVFYFIVRLYIYRSFCRCVFDRCRGTKTFHKILRGTSTKKVKKHCNRALVGIFSGENCLLKRAVCS